MLNRAEERRKQVIQRLRNDKTTKHCQVLTIRLIGSIGRACYLQSNSSKIVSFQVEDLTIISHLPETDRLTLWKYAQSIQKQISSGDVRSISPLDTFAFYYYNGFSFHRKNAIDDRCALSPGFSRPLRVKKCVETDRHIVLRNNPLTYIPVVLYNEHDGCKIYAPEMKINLIPGLLVEG